jgi:predicted RecA/RadA family phage recombinase
MANMYLRDEEYCALNDVTLSGTVTKGEIAAIGDTYGFYMTDGVNGDEVAFVYKAKQALVSKLSGTGETITSGERVWYSSSDGKVDGTKAGNYSIYFGTALVDAAATDTTVLIEFDGTLNGII